MTKRRATILVLVLLMLALASVLTLPLARIGLTQSFSSQRTANSLRHRMAAESLLTLLPGLTGKGSRLLRDLDDHNRASIYIDMNGIAIHAILQDDSAKLPIAAVARSMRQGGLEQTMEFLATRTGMPPIPLRRDPIVNIGCLDDLFEGASDDHLFGHDQGGGWVSVLTPLGQSVNIQRAEPATLAAMMWDIDRKAADKLARALRTSQRKSAAELISSAGLSGDAASRLEQRLSTQTLRYSVLVKTTLHSDIRRRYFICSADDPPTLLVDWEVAP